MPRAPDILFIVLDCVSTRDFSESGLPSPQFPHARELAKGGTVFTHAVSPASWTIPAHASMFTGLYPWDHGDFGRAAPLLTPDVRTIGEELRKAGYSTGAFSANPCIWPGTGLTRGFETVQWGAVSDCSLRRVSSWVSHPRTSNGGVGVPPAHSWFSDHAANLLSYTSQSFPLAVDSATRAAAWLLSKGRSVESVTCPWIEQSISQWLKSLSPERPSFCFVNLLDAHEPYIGFPEEITSFGDWIRALQPTQWDTGLLAGRNGHASDSDRPDRVKSLYLKSLQVLDRRLGHLFDMFARARDWERTCVIVTSDHGQAFTKHERMFHCLSSSPSVHRVPLILRPAGPDRLNPAIDGWVSTKDVLAALSPLAQGPADSPSGGTHPAVERLAQSQDAIMTLVDEPAPRPPVGSPRSPRDSLKAVIGYKGSLQVTVSVGSGGPLIRTVDSGDVIESEEARKLEPEIDALILRMRAAADEVRLRDSSFTPGGVDLRLRGWGY